MNLRANVEMFDNNLSIDLIKLSDGGFYTYETIINYPLSKYSLNYDDINTNDSITITRVYYVDVLGILHILCYIY